jgi:hypothetical protein
MAYRYLVITILLIPMFFYIFDKIDRIRSFSDILFPLTVGIVIIILIYTLRDSVKG